MATLYQKVKKALGEKGPITYPNLADSMGADEEAVRQALFELRRRGKAKYEGNTIAHGRVALWTIKSR